MPDENNQSLILLIGEIKGKMDLMVSAVNTLSASFENLEKGRLSKAEIEIAELKISVSKAGENAKKEAKTQAMWIALIASGLISIMIFLAEQAFLYYFK